MVEFQAVHARVAASAGELVSLFRALHEIPEVGLELPKTQARVLEGLADLPLTVRRGSNTSAVVALLRSPHSTGRPVLLRADMDALPLHEETELPYRSRHDGAMHACGHDGHTAMLVTAARVLCGMRTELPCDVVFFFQPGEEGHDGCRQALAEGLLDGECAPGRVFALHVVTALPSGTITTRGGPALAGADGLRLTIKGRGGHVGLPHQAIDPVPVLCSIVAGIQQWLARRIDPFDPAVVTVNRIDAGTDGAGLIPDHATAQGTIRTFSETTRQKVWAGLTELGEYTAAAYGCTANVEITPGYPPTVNDTRQANWALELAAGLFGTERASVLPSRLPASEDFSYLLQQYPGAMLFLGAAPSVPCGPMHSARMILNEEALAVGAAMLSTIALAQPLD